MTTLLRFGALAAGALMSTAAVAQEVRIGEFDGVDGHPADGTAKVMEVNGLPYVILEQDFEIDQAPRPVVALANAAGDVTLLGILDSLRGPQRYEIPPEVDAANYGAVYIWCLAGEMPLAIAPLQPEEGS